MAPAFNVGFTNDSLPFSRNIYIEILSLRNRNKKFGKLTNKFSEAVLLIGLCVFTVIGALQARCAKSEQIFSAVRFSALCGLPPRPAPAAAPPGPDTADLISQTDLVTSASLTVNQ